MFVWPSRPCLRHALRLQRITCLEEPIDDVFLDQIMVLVLFANSERVGAGTCPRLNLGAYFLLGILNEQFFVDDLHGVDMVHERHLRRRPCRRRPRAAALSTATLAAALAADALSRDARCWLLSRDARCWLPI